MRPDEYLPRAGSLLNPRMIHFSKAAVHYPRRILYLPLYNLGTWPPAQPYSTCRGPTPAHNREVKNAAAAVAVSRGQIANNNLGAIKTALPYMPTWRQDTFSRRRNTFMPYATPLKPMFAGERAHVDLWDIANGCILWLPPKDQIRPASIEQGRGLLKKDIDAFDHPVLVLDVDIKSPTDEMVTFATITSFSDAGGLKNKLQQWETSWNLRGQPKGESNPIQDWYLPITYNGDEHADENSLHLEEAFRSRKRAGLSEVSGPSHVSYVNLRHIYTIDYSELKCYKTLMDFRGLDKYNMNTSIAFESKYTNGWHYRLSKPSFDKVAVYFKLKPTVWRDTWAGIWDGFLQDTGIRMKRSDRRVDSVMADRETQQGSWQENDGELSKARKAKEEQQRRIEWRSLVLEARRENMGSSPIEGTAERDKQIQPQMSNSDFHKSTREVSLREEMSPAKKFNITRRIATVSKYDPAGFTWIESQENGGFSITKHVVSSRLEIKRIKYPPKQTVETERKALKSQKGHDTPSFKALDRPPENRKFRIKNISSSRSSAVSGAKRDLNHEDEI